MTSRFYYLLSLETGLLRPIVFTILSKVQTSLAQAFCMVNAKRYDRDMMWDTHPSAITYEGL